MPSASIATVARSASRSVLLTAASKCAAGLSSAPAEAVEDVPLGALGLTLLLADRLNALRRRLLNERHW